MTGWLPVPIDNSPNDMALTACNNAIHKITRCRSFHSHVSIIKIANTKSNAVRIGYSQLITQIIIYAPPLER